MNLKITQKGWDAQPQVKDTNTNAVAWDIVKAMFKLRNIIPFDDLCVATKGHIHGSGRWDAPSDGVIRYFIRLGWLKVL